MPSVHYSVIGAGEYVETELFHDVSVMIRYVEVVFHSFASEGVARRPLHSGNHRI